MPLIEINNYDIIQTAKYINVEIYDFIFGTGITLKISFYDTNNVFLLFRLIELIGQDYIDMTTSGSSDAYIKNFVETSLGITIL